MDQINARCKKLEVGMLLYSTVLCYTAKLSTTSHRSLRPATNL
jgi:hypothetical protein